MNTLTSMVIGGCVMTAILVGLQSIPELQWIAVAVVGLAGVAVATNTAMRAIQAARPHGAPQPVAQPVPQPVDALSKYYPVEQPVVVFRPQPPQPVAARAPQPLAQPVAADPQPLVTGAQPDRNRWIDMMAGMIQDPIPATRRVPWLEETVELNDDPVDLPEASVPALPLPRRAPTAAEYPLVWDAIQAAGSRNAAILAVYGSKDGKTHRWVSRVADFYLNPSAGVNGPVATAAAVFRHEIVGACDMPGLVAARLGLEIDDDDQLAELMAGLEQCEECSAWYAIDCPCQQEVT